jgi:TP901 family phage tail tape measure protein
MAIKKDVLQTTLLLDGKQAINQLGKLEMEYADVSRSLKGLKRNHKDYARLAGDQRKIHAAITKTREKLGIQGMTLTQLIRYEKDLQRTRSNSTTRGTKEYKRLTAEIKKASRAITHQRNQAKGMTGFWATMSKEVKQFGMIAVGYLGITAVTEGLSNLIKRSGDLSDVLAAVTKTTTLTADQVDSLNSSLGKMDTRTGRKEMLAMAKVAGKLGFTASKDVEGFVRAFDKINVALGEDLGAPEQVARKLGKIIESFSVTDAYNIEEALEKVGSSINHLGKSSTATEGYIVEFTRRMAGIAPLANLSLQNVMGLGATLDALGQTSEVSSTSLNKMFLKMTQNSEVFANYALDANGAKMTTEQFTELIETDFNEAFISLLRGVKDNSDGMTELSETLGMLSLDGGRIIGVLGTLANNTDLLQEQQKISNDEFKKGTSVLNEFNLMNDTLGAKLDKLRKKINSALVSTTLISGLESFVGWIIKFTEIDAVSVLKDEQRELNILTGALINANENEELRSKLISEIDDKYPNFLKNMDTETVNASQLADRLKEVNKQYQQKIILTAAEDDIKELVQEQVLLMNERLDIEKELARLRMNPDKVISSGGKGAKLTAGQLADRKEEYLVAGIEKRLANIDVQIEGINDRKNDLIEAFDLDFFNNNTSPTTNNDNNPSPVPTIDQPTALDGVLGDSDDQDKKIKEYLQKLEDSFTQERTALTQKRVLGLITDQAYNIEMEQLELAHLYVMQGLREDLGLQTIDLKESIFEKELAIIQKREDAEKKSHVEIKSSHIALNDGIREGLQGLGAAFGAFADIQAQESERSITQALRAKNVMIIANKAAALSSAIAGAAEAAAATGPGAPFALLGYVTAMVGTVISAFAGIKSNHSQASSARQDLKSKGSGRSYFDGGEVGDTSRNQDGDFYGKFSEFPTHTGEYVVPAWNRSHPSVINAVKVIEANRNGYSLNGGQNNTSNTANLESGKFEMAVDRFEGLVDVLITKGLKTYFSRNEYKDAKEDDEEKQSAKNRGSI